MDYLKLYLSLLVLQCLKEYENEAALHHRLGKRIAKKNNIPYLDLLSNFKSSGELKDVEVDIIHPNENGHRIIADALFDYLQYSLNPSSGTLSIEK